MKGLIRATVAAAMIAGGMAGAQEMGAEDAPPPSADRPVADPSVGAVTNLPLPRFVTLKTSEGNARRGPGLTHRIDWVFTRDGMPLKITAEYGHWRRVEDFEGAGGWVHYALLSGTRSALITAPLALLHADASADSAVVLKAEKDVIGTLQECQKDWCRLRIDGNEGWIAKADFWGVGPDEILN
ncbi:SH3 domain-containing protein [Falsirhodobacter sp. 20TX0035]|uniref:SH3 domain-containing protein n=1 Tax=Falsirhodobacter sp. 20TX0035 TaxID=3022019 RepID=UPI003FA550D1